MKEGYVTFVNDNNLYVELTKILIDSVLEFSTKFIEVFSINFDFKYLNDDRIIYRRINLDKVDFETICYAKLYSTFNSSLDYGVQCDADMIISKNADKLFEKCYEIEKTPLGSLHPVNINNWQNIMDYLDVKEQTQPYVHATYLFSNSCKPFLEECYKVSQDILKNRIRPNNFDETIYNVMLWKYGSTKYVDCYDPYWECFINTELLSLHGYVNKVNNYICHGLKDINKAREVFYKIKYDDIK